MRITDILIRSTLLPAFILAALLCTNSPAAEMQLWGKPLSIHGYLSQSVGFGIAGEHFDTQESFQSAIFQGLIEGTYEPRHDMRIFLSGRFNADWAYQALKDNTNWRDKGFDESRGKLYVFDDFKDILNEAHITWRPDHFYFRLGKQIVRWGETDGFRLMDQINPLDQRRGLADVEFETTIQPTWLVRAEYGVPDLPDWCQSLSFQVIFNPNLQFVPNESMKPGNDVSGIWSPYIEIPTNRPYPRDFGYMGSADSRLTEPGGSDGFEYALRLRAVVRDTVVTLNYYYGSDKDPVVRTAGLPRPEVSPYDGRTIFHPNVEGYYPMFRFVGGTLTTDIDPLQSTALGGVAPLLRLEGFYAFNKTFTWDRLNAFEQHDEIRWAAGIDWKVKIPLLNQLSFFTISPQFYHRKIMNYPGEGMLSGPGGESLRENNYQASLMISTGYLGGKLQPSFFWLRNISEKANFFRLQTVYDWSHHWRYTLGVLFFDGDKAGKSYQALKHKDQLYLTISYRF
ncbi:MAG TPA: hypothetical protein PLR60_13740 [Syntrophorhabdaceae bacterium]|nr:hypothetical protein [Syntrophorhabdaceae bacterium]